MDENPKQSIISHNDIVCVFSSRCFNTFARVCLITVI